MHQQIRASPDDTAGNIRLVVNALAKHSINIEAIAPDFDPPHVRVLVEHLEPYDAGNREDPFNRALAALEQEGLTPEIRAAVMLKMPNKPRALKAALDRLTREGYAVECILVLPGEPAPGSARVSLGVARTDIAGWDDGEVDALSSRIEAEIGALPPD